MGGDHAADQKRRRTLAVEDQGTAATLDSFGKAPEPIQRQGPAQKAGVQAPVEFEGAIEVGQRLVAQAAHQEDQSPVKKSDLVGGRAAHGFVKIG